MCLQAQFFNAYLSVLFQCPGALIFMELHFACPSSTRESCVQDSEHFLVTDNALRPPCLCKFELGCSLGAIYFGQEN